MNKAVLSLLLPAALLMASSPGIRPRADAQSYPTHQEQADYSIGAVLIPPEQVKKMFKLDLNHAGYIVVEVGVFPAPGKDVDLYPTDFTLSVGDKLAALRPVSADTVAELAAGKPSPPHTNGPRDVNTSVGASVGHVSYPDPVTGRRTSGTITETDAGVGNWRTGTATLPRVQLRFDRTNSIQLANLICASHKRDLARPLGEVAARWKGGACSCRLSVLPETDSESKRRRLGIAL